MTTTRNFEQLLKWGQVGETAIACWIRQQGYSVLPAYDIPLDTGKGPRLYTSFASAYSQLVAPDLLAMSGEKIQWVEAKRKTRFTWRRIPTGRWQTGIDLRHYHQYLKVKEETHIPLWIMFLHMSSEPSASDLAHGCPPSCPTGLFGNEITYLEENKSHEDSYTSSYGRSYPMVYWDIKHLMPRNRPLATLEDVLATQPTPPDGTDDDAFDIDISF